MASRIQQFFTQNLRLKIISVLLATALWYAIAREPFAEVEVVVPIEFHNISENLEISSERVPQAQIRVRGPASVVRKLGQSGIHAEINLEKIGAGEHTFNLTSQEVRAPRELSVVQVVPAQLQLTLDKRELREVEVRPRVVGQFAQGRHIARVTASPAKILVAGPKQRVDAVESAITDPIDATGTMQQGSFTTRAYVSDPLVQVVKNDVIHVTVIIEKTAFEPGAETSH